VAFASLYATRTAKVKSPAGTHQTMPEQKHSQQEIPASQKASRATTPQRATTPPAPVIKSKAFAPAESPIQ